MKKKIWQYLILISGILAAVYCVGRALTPCGREED